MGISRYVLFCLSILLLALSSPIAAQVIPSDDGTNTTVLQDGRIFRIGGGQFSSDELNLFHSLLQLDLSNGDTANFLSSTSLENILVKVVGGELSYIDGMLEISSGNPNLFLINPSGVVFGSNAVLNLPSSLTVSTADRIRFDSGEEWNIFDSFNYEELIGSPNEYAFTEDSLGLIYNSAELDSSMGSLSLFARTVVSPGTLSAPEGDIAVVATGNGRRTVKVRAEGSLIELSIPISTTLQNQNISLIDLPSLLTGSGITEDIIDVEAQSGNIFLSDTASNFNNVYGANDVYLQDTHSIRNDLSFVSESNIYARDSTEHPLILESGGNLLLRGNESIDLYALNHPNSILTSGGDTVLVSNGIVSGDAHYRSGGRFSIQNLSEQPGRFHSIDDPIISARGNVVFGNYEGAALKIESLGNITGGNILITGPDANLSVDDADSELLAEFPALILRAGLNSLSNSENIPINQESSVFSLSGSASETGAISVGDITTTGTSTSSGPVILSGPGGVRTSRIDTAFFPTATSDNSDRAGDVIIRSTNGNIVVEEINTRTGSRVAGNIDIASSSGNIIIDAIDATTSSGVAGDVDIRNQTGSVDIEQIETSASSGVAGDIDIETLLGSIDAGNISTNSSSGVSGDISLISNSGNIRTENIDSGVSSGVSGDVEIFSSSGLITTGDIDTGSSSGVGGDVNISSNTGDIQTGDIDNSSSTGVSGDVNVASTAGSVNVSSITASSTTTTATQVIERGNTTDEAVSGVPVEENTPAEIISEELSSNVENRLDQNSQGDGIPFTTQEIDNQRQEEFEEYFGINFPRRFTSVKDITYALLTTNERTGTNSAVIFPLVSEDSLRIRVRTAEGIYDTDPIDISQQELQNLSKSFYEAIQDPFSNEYKQYAAAMYDYLIEPLEDHLEEQKVDVLLFAMQPDIRLIPIAALYDQEEDKFLIEKYDGISIIPNFGSIDIRYTDINQLDVLAAGSSFSADSSRKGVDPIPAVPLELMAIKNYWDNETTLLIGEDFNTQNLNATRRQKPFQILHLATHTDITSGEPRNSIIQLQDTDLSLSTTLPELLGWTSVSDNGSLPSIDLLVLSACETALDSQEAEFGFAGLSLRMNVKSTLASLWQVSDVGTMLFMTLFYKNLNRAAVNSSPAIKAKVLKETQVEMINLYREKSSYQIFEYLMDSINLLENEDLPGHREMLETLNISPAEAAEVAERVKPKLSALIEAETGEKLHPYFWSSFTLVGSPW